MAEETSKANESKTPASPASTGTRATSTSEPSVPAPVDPIAGERPAAERQVEQLGSDWPKPGDEGYVHPDGTPQAAAQIKANRQAAADRAAAGSAVHGAPAATPGPQIDAVAAAAVERAEADNGGEADAERERKLTEFVRDAQATNPAARNADDGGKRAAR
jgi:hypothetical protein